MSTFENNTERRLPRVSEETCAAWAQSANEYEYDGMSYLFGALKRFKTEQDYLHSIIDGVAEYYAETADEKKKIMAISGLLYELIASQAEADDLNRNL